MDVRVQGKIVKLPDFLIVGAVRGGTTSLYNYLKQHPQIFMPKEKEPQFFAFSEKPTHYPHPPIIWKFDDYVKLFENAEESQLIGEASLGYSLCYEETINNIKKYIPEWKKIRIIMSLRNPIERVFSLHAVYTLAKIETLPFEQAIDPDVISERQKDNWGPWFDYIGVGYSYEQVKAYKENFAHVKIFLYEDLKADTPGVVKEIFRFLGVDDSYVPDTREKHNPSGAYKGKRIQKLLEKPGVVSSIFPVIKVMPLEKREAVIERLKLLNLKKFKKMKMKTKTQLLLSNIYREDITKLQDIIGRDLSGWLK